MKTKNIVTWVIAGLLTLAFTGAGVSKLMGIEMQLKNLESWGYPVWFRYPIGISELILAAGLLFTGYRKITVYLVYLWGAIAVFTHIQASPPQYQMLGGPVVFLLLNTVLFFLIKSDSK